MKDGQLVAAALIIMTSLGMFTVVETGGYGYCRSGEWLSTINPFEYQCSTNLDRIETCAKISGTRCYYGEVKEIKIDQIEPDNFAVIKDGIRYHCYKNKGYCLEEGDISLEKISLVEVSS